MKITKDTALLAINCTVVLFASAGFAHDTELHSLMSEQAAKSSENFSRFFADNFDTGTPSQSKFTFNSKNLTAIAWISKGSIDEDDDFRVKHHFYVPAVHGEPSGRGLTDPPTGGATVSSFEWVSEAVPGYANSESWKKAREYQFGGFIKSSKSARNADLGHMFYSLGHVIHLNQDLSQPSHTRDDNHAPVLGPASEIEKYGLKKYYPNALKTGYGSAFPTSGRSGHQWHAAGFDKLEEFWDRKLYTGQAQALVANEAGSGLTQTTLGLAEYSNGNFLSDDAVYTEVKNLDPRHRFPFPSFVSGTDYRTALQLPSTAARPVLLRDDLPKNRLYFAKVGDGKTMTYHSAWSYLTAKKKEVVKVSINDNNVLQEYLTILVPKAIEYSAGILDYFFRGKIDVVAGYDDFDDEYKIFIANRSGQDLLGGGFTLLQEDAAGNRTPVAWSTLSYTGSLPDGACVEGTLPGPVSTTTKYVVVFKGTIGSSGGQAIDSVDAGIAIAAKQFNLYPFPANDPNSGFRVRIQNYAQVVSALIPCDDCPASALPAWDGTFDHVEFYQPGPYLNIYPSALGGAGLSINGKHLSDAYVWWDEFNGVGVYEVRIFCVGHSLPVWVGRKTTGSDHTGEYVRAWDWLDDCEWFCSELERIVIESY